MSQIQELMKELATKLGDKVVFKGLLTKTARIRKGQGSTPEDILGWDYLFRAEHGVCYQFYAA